MVVDEDEAVVEEEEEDAEEVGAEVVLADAVEDVEEDVLPKVVEAAVLVNVEPADAELEGPAVDPSPEVLPSSAEALSSLPPDVDPDSRSPSCGSTQRFDRQVSPSKHRPSMHPPVSRPASMASAALSHAESSRI